MSSFGSLNVFNSEIQTKFFMDNLYSLWQTHWKHYTSDKRWVKTKFEELSNFYEEKHRYYHNLDHIQSLFNSFLDYKTKLTQPDEIAFAIWYHDLIYDVESKENELKSAQYAVKVLSDLNIASQKMERIYQLILSTKKHEALLPGVDNAYFIDFDLAILGKNWSVYKDYARKIRQEYAIYPDQIYLPGRIQALEHFLKRPQIFQTGIFIENYEKQARKNIAQEIEQIKANLS